MPEERRAGPLTIAELARLAGVSARTVRYYIAEGLLPPPAGTGQRRSFTYEHVVRLRAIKRLKESYLPLGEIRRQLAALSLSDMDKLIAEPAEPPPGSAMDYLSRVLASAHEPRSAAISASGKLREGVSPIQMERQATVAGLWQRVNLAPGVELHYQTSQNSRRHAAIAQLIAAAASILADLPSALERDL